MLTLFAATSVATRVAQAWPWYVVRAAGFIAVGLLILLIISGIAQVTGLMYRFFEPVKAWAIHKALGYALALAVMVHVGFLLIDTYLPFSLSQALIPFVSGYKPVSIAGVQVSLWVAAGIVGLYGLAIILVTSWLLIDRQRKLWKGFHYLSYAVMALIFVHALYLGSDLRYGTFRSAWLAIGGLIILAIGTRLWRAGLLKHRSS
ncbi:ferric reductase-like transmembrane domain-containing protein [Candidatus Saccharibacteria bacterium]|nr:ferric reductase-like transmembrane domain-containing protein [Candidatus Saccharibacteria bacterium]